jgi:hypothetical protein
MIFSPFLLLAASDCPDPARDDPHPPPKTPGPPERATPRWLFVIVGFFICLGPAAGAYAIAVTYPQGSVSGEVRSRGAPHGDFSIFPETCFSGDHWGFDGVWLVTETRTSGDRTGFQGGLKIIREEDGPWAAVLENPQRCEVFTCEQTQVLEQTCAVFDLAVERPHRWWRYRGHARLDCAFAEGGTLTADLSFARCGWVPSTGESADTP